MRIVFCGGGTGGHVYPALTVAAALRRLYDSEPLDLLYIGVKGKIDAELVQREGIAFRAVTAGPLRGGSPTVAASGGLKLAAGAAEAFSILAHFRPDVVFATGGYGSVGVGMAAKLQRRPLLVFLPDVAAGMAVRSLARIADRIAVTVPPAQAAMPSAKTTLTGYPVRPAFFEATREAGRGRFGLDPSLPTLLVTGGSTGATTLNRAVAAFAPEFLRTGQLLHISGRIDETWLQAERDQLPPELKERYHLHAYLHDDMALAMAAADLAVMRAGASTLGELPATRLPAILIPGDFSDQAANARYLEREGAAVMLPQSNLAALPRLVMDLMGDAGRREAMREALSRLARPDAAERLARLIAAMAGVKDKVPACIDYLPPQRVHLVGIGGMHMSAIGRILLARGVSVTGSDLRRSPLTDTLAELGATVFIGPHDAANLGEVDLVVTTSAATADNPELNEARRRGTPVIKRADMVARLMEDKIGICVAGCHGKSTTSGLIAYILSEVRLDPTYLIGAEVAALGTNAAPGTGPYVVVEADEYDRAFLSYHPQLALVTNVEADHLDYYGTWEAVQEAFRGFAANVEPGGTLVLCADNAEALSLRESVVPGVRIVTYGLDSESEWDAWQIEERNGRQMFTAVHEGRTFGRFTLQLAGRHNVQNALGAIAACERIGIPAEGIADAMERYTGVRRRFEPVGEAAGVLVMDDYAHHPTEIAALAAAMRSRFAGRRLVVLFQPHTYARSRYLLEGFRTCFRGFDRLFLLETYAAREPLADGMTAAQLAAEIKEPAPTYCETFEAAADAVAADLRPGDVFFTVGAGDVDSVGPLVLERLREAQ